MVHGDCDQISSSKRSVRGEVRTEVHLQTSRKSANIKVTLRSSASGCLSSSPPTAVQKEQGATVEEK